MRPGIDQYAWSMAMLHIHAIMLMHRGMGHRKLCAGSIIAQSRFTADNFAKRRLGPRLGALSVVGRKAGSTLRSSRAVPHPSTNRALRRLTAEVGRDPVHSTRYGRQRESGFNQNLSARVKLTGNFSTFLCPPPGDPPALADRLPRCRLGARRGREGRPPGAGRRAISQDGGPAQAGRAKHKIAIAKFPPSIG